MSNPITIGREDLLGEAAAKLIKAFGEYIGSPMPGYSVNNCL